MSIIINLLLLSIAILIVAQIMPSIHIKNVGTVIIVAIVYSLINFFTGWFLVLLTLPLVIITFGLFKFVINAFLLWITDKLIEDFKIDSFRSTLIAAFLITVIDSVLEWLV
ncbi:MAG: phage holin family protein [Chitinispirillia bacterium]